MHGHEEGLNHIEMQAFVRDKLEKSTKSSKMHPKLYTVHTKNQWCPQLFASVRHMWVENI